MTIEPTVRGLITVLFRRKFDGKVSTTNLARDTAPALQAFKSQTGIRSLGQATERRNALEMQLAMLTAPVQNSAAEKYHAADDLGIPVLASFGDGA